MPGIKAGKILDPTISVRNGRQVGAFKILQIVQPVFYPIVAIIEGDIVAVKQLAVHRLPRAGASVTLPARRAVR